MTISLELSEEDVALFKKYAGLHNMSLSEFIRRTVFERVEDEYDLKVYEEALEEFKKDPTTCTLDEMKERFKIK
nr:MAG TPA: antitoxin [Caudoviricetes sp.]